MVLFQLKYEECNQYKNKLEEYERIQNTPDSIDFLFENCVYMEFGILYYRAKIVIEAPMENFQKYLLGNI